MLKMQLYYEFAGPTDPQTHSMQFKVEVIEYYIYSYYIIAFPELLSQIEKWSEKLTCLHIYVRNIAILILGILKMKTKLAELLQAILRPP